ncbi:putative polyketide synthase [Periconia macrospinosa]|uniref:Putative polyketide synthase n=1 Tax=Periconia macrospinosa TaxID=97972 RepID=A0A2V1DGF9_9PLEO|nr:putative polyketide synthase [Periconia macrospinosa]
MTIPNRPTNLVLFGDQTVEKRTSIQTLVRHSKTSHAARRLLQEATDLVQLHFNRLSDEDKQWDHEIHTLLGLAEDNIAESKPNGAIATVLMCIGRLGELLVYAEEDPSILGSENDPVEVLAFCTGLLPAAALVAARDTSELFDLAKEIIAITLRMTLEMHRRIIMIEDTNLSWATTLVGKTPGKVQPILDEFHQSQHIPYSKRIAIAVVSTGWLTLIGAPSSLRRLMEFSKELEDAPKMKTETNGAVHTQYMPTYDLEKVLGNSPLLELPITSKARIHSPASCKQYTHTTLRSLMSEILPDIAHRILRIDDTAEACISKIASDKPLVMTVAGPTGHQTAVEKVLKSKSIKYQIKEHRRANKDSGRGGSDSIAIVGMSSRLPGSDNVEAFFESLLEQQVQIKKIPKSRFDLETYYDPTGERRHTTSTDQGAFLDRPGYFDNRLFSISAREAAQMDPLQRMLLTTSYEALEMAGYSKNATPSTQDNRIAVYFGQAADDWRGVLNNDEEIDIYYVPSLSRAFGPSRVSYHHKWGGGTYALDAACATSTTAIHLACKALSSRECDTALAGGGSLCVSPTAFAGLTKSGMVSEKGGCRTYHDDADGYARGEGIGVVVLKRLEDAIAENDNILGVIRGHARTYTSTSTSITHPSAECQARVYEEVLRQTSVVPNEIAYAEMHGTGTQAGDYEEMSSVIRVLGQDRSKKNVLTVGAVKANVAHGEAVAGVTSLIKVLMMMKEKKIPPQPGLPFKLNRKFPRLENVNVRIAGIGNKDLTLKPSPASSDGKIKCLVSSFDASGGNTSLVVEEAPAVAKKTENPLPAHVVTISARTSFSLQQNRKSLLDYLMRNPQTKLADLAYSTTARRMHEVLRVAYSGKTTKEIINSLREDVSSNGAKDPKKKALASSVVFAFTGQGSQYAGMGRQLYQHSAELRAALQNYEQMAEHQGLPKFLHLIADEKVDIAAASATEVQLAVVALEITTAKLVESWGIKPDFVVGHSLGEYAALCVAGVLSGSDALYLVGRRAQLMEQQLTAGEYAMLAISKDADSARKLLAEQANVAGKTAVACINAPQVTVVSGPVKEIDNLKVQLEREGSRATVLRTPYGFHSHHIEPILDAYKAIAQGVTFAAPTIPVASTLLGNIVEIGDTSVFSADYLVRQAREQVNFTGALQSLQNGTGAKVQSTFVEIGPEPVCLGLVRRTLDIPTTRLLPMIKSSEDNWSTVSSALASLYQAGADIKWSRYHQNFVGSLRLLPLPTYAFDEKNFWKAFVEPINPGLALPAPSNALEKSSKIPVAPAFSTTTLQWIESETVTDKTTSVVFAAHTAEPHLYEAIKGHVVNGVTLMSLSIFCDMAKTGVQYAYQKLVPGSKVPKMSVYDMNMTHALVVPHADPEQIVRTKVTLSQGENFAHVSFSSTKKGSSTEHGDAKIVFEDSAAFFAEQSQTSFLVSSRIDALKDMSSTGKAHHLLKSVAYKLFDNLVAYGKNYQAMEELWVDEYSRDAVCTVKLPNTAGSGTFTHNPFWADAAVHLAGFLVNSGLKYPEEIVCLSTGFSSSRLIEELQQDETYTTYVTMQDTETPNILTGSAYVYNGKMKLVQVSTVLTSILGGSVAARATPSTSVPLPPVEKTVAWQKDLLAVSNRTRPSTGFSTPATQVTDYSFSEAGYRSGVSTPATSIESPPASAKPDLFAKLQNIVIAESGCSESDLEPGASFADLGMDSLMAITILATFQKETGVELPPTFFLDHQTVAEVKEALPGGDSNEAKGASPADSEDETEATPKAILLNGTPGSTTTQSVFLLPDASGSPSRYIQLPSFGDSLCTYGLESPFLKTSLAEAIYSVPELCVSFANAIQDVQPHGPYILGGFSVGALYAFEVAKVLSGRGEAVEKLLLVDMSVPSHNTNVGEIDLATLTAAGMLPTQGRMLASQKEHFVSALRALAAYKAVPFSSTDKRPQKTTLVSSNAGLAVGKTSDLACWAQGASEGVARGWAALLAGDEVVEVKVDAEHWSLFRHPHVSLFLEVITLEMV